jgi:hypothetical protein
MRSLRLLPLAVLAAAPLATLGAAEAKTSHAGWPTIDGALKINKSDRDKVTRGLAARHNELLGGHGDDTIVAGDAGDVIWGDYKPSGQPTTQVDHLDGGAGDDFIYASHGLNYIDTGAGSDTVHAHFGRGEIRCGSARTIVFISHRSRPGYRLVGCRRISYRTLGY